MSAARSTPDLFKDLAADFSNLFRKEVQLARAEAGEKLSQAITGLVLIAVGAVLLLAAFVVLLCAAVEWIVYLGLARYWANLIVGGIVALLGLVCVLRALHNLKGENLIPRRTIRQFSLRTRPADAAGQ